jgi:hypothetical protein
MSQKREETRGAKILAQQLLAPWKNLPGEDLVSFVANGEEVTD